MKKNNLNNANKDFQNISNCNFNGHWGYSIFFKNLAILEQINKLPDCSRVLEIGAANSYLEDYVKINLKKNIEFMKMDVNRDYELQMIIGSVLQVDKLFTVKFDMIVLSEVIEHLPNKTDSNLAIKQISSILKPGGILVLTTPTPTEDDELVWPDDHLYEFRFEEIYEIINNEFEINKVMPWSMKERDYQTMLENDKFAQQLFCKLKGKLNDGLIQAILSLVAPNELSRQTLMVCKKRRPKMKEPWSDLI